MGVGLQQQQELGEVDEELRRSDIVVDLGKAAVLGVCKRKSYDNDVAEGDDSYQMHRIHHQIPHHQLLLLIIFALIDHFQAHYHLQHNIRCRQEETHDSKGRIFYAFLQNQHHHGNR